MKILENQFSGARVRLARSFHGLTVAELAEEVSVSQQFLSKLETGEKQPSDSLLAALADVLRFDPAFFYDPPFEEFLDEQCHFRSRKSTPQRLRRRALAHGTLFGILVAYFDSRLSLPKNNIPTFRTEGGLSVEEIAERSRIHWGLGIDAPITNMTRLLETSGVVVTKFLGHTAKVDAFSRSGRRSIVVLNTAKDSASRSRWDLAHETGHLVLHSGRHSDEPDVEKQANGFASAFLLPRKAMLREFRHGQLDWGMLFDLKQRWRTSVSALVHRGYDLGLLNAAQYRRAYKYINAKRWHVGEPFEPPAEQPEVVQTALDVLEKKKGESPLAVARHLHWRPEILEEVLGFAVARPQGPLAEVASIEAFRSSRRS